MSIALAFHIPDAFTHSAVIEKFVFPIFSGQTNNAGVLLLVSCVFSYVKSIYPLASDIDLQWASTVLYPFLYPSSDIFVY